MLLLLGRTDEAKMRKGLPDIFISEIEVAWLRIGSLRILLACQTSVWAMCERLAVRYVQNDFSPSSVAHRNDFVPVTFSVRLGCSWEHMRIRMGCVNVLLDGCSG